MLSVNHLFCFVFVFRFYLPWNRWPKTKKGHLYLTDPRRSLVTEWLARALDCYAGSLPYEPSILPLLKHTCYSPPCGPSIGRQLSHHRLGYLLWLWNPEKTSPEVQNRGISGPIKGLMFSKIKKKHKYIYIYIFTCNFISKRWFRMTLCCFKIYQFNQFDMVNISKLYCANLLHRILARKT